MTITYTSIGSFVTENCYKCGISFGLPSGFQKEKLENGGNFCCPNGHGQYYGESTVKKLEQRIIRELSQHDQTKANLRDTKLSLIAEKGHRTRLKKRIVRGICPCCNRSFQNLKRHMDGQHPKYTDKKKNQKGLKAIK
jgi:hypothetical protein